LRFEGAIDFSYCDIPYGLAKNLDFALKNNFSLPSGMVFIFDNYKSQQMLQFPNQQLQDLAIATATAIATKLTVFRTFSQGTYF
jgi:hypothetical protein